MYIKINKKTQEVRIDHKSISAYVRRIDGNVELEGEMSSNGVDSCRNHCPFSTMRGRIVVPRLRPNRLGKEAENEYWIVSSNSPHDQKRIYTHPDGLSQDSPDLIDMALTEEERATIEEMLTFARIEHDWNGIFEKVKGEIEPSGRGEATANTLREFIDCTGRAIPPSYIGTCFMYLSQQDANGDPAIEGRIRTCKEIARILDFGEGTDAIRSGYQFWANWVSHLQTQDLNYPRNAALLATAKRERAQIEVAMYK